VLDRVMAGRSTMTPLAEYPEHSPWVYGAGWWRVSDRGHEFVQHGGTVTGSSTWITLMPDDDIAVVALVNGNGQHKALQALTGRVVEDSFGLEHVDWIGRFLKTSEEERNERQNRKHSGPPTTPSIKRFTGTYYNPGYIGNFTLCAWPAETGSPCEEVWKIYSIADADFETEKAYTLYARWKRFWHSHLKMVQQSDNIFVPSLDTLYPEGYGQDDSPFYIRSTADDALAEFKIEGDEVVGLGIWGASAGPQERVPGDPEHTSEVWFEKIA